MKILAGDIGGTNTRLCLVDSQTQATIREEVYPSGKEGLVPIVKKFLGATDTPQRACFALAGPVLNNRCQLTNLAWPELIADNLSSALQIPQVSLINDFVAVAYAIVLQSDLKLVTLQPGKPLASAPIAIVGAGTGLGRALAIATQDGYQVYPSESGHSNFAPASPLQQGLLSYLTPAYEPVGLERVVSGPGIINIFRFLRDHKFPGEDTSQLLEQPDPAAAIAIAAKRGHFLARATMKLFVETYGAALGDLALQVLPYGGIYIAGGIAAKNIELMQTKRFKMAFGNKQKINSSLLDDIPIHIVCNDLEGLKGAALYALQSC